jgi:hypothetical protein
MKKEGDIHQVVFWIVIIVFAILGMLLITRMIGKTPVPGLGW